MIILENVTKKYHKKAVIDNLSLKIGEGERLAVMGSSGVGKTTLLRIIAGLERVDGGFVSKQKCSVVFQDPTLLDWLTAVENVELVTDNSKENAYRLLEALGFDKEDCHKKPAELSGGMKQRVSIARALNFRADCYLFDEAFKGLDEKLAEQVIDTVKEELKDKILIFVTHSQKEAEKLGTDTLVLR